MKYLVLVSLSLSVVAAAIISGLSCLAANGIPGQGSDYYISERGPDHRVWSRVTARTNAAGRVSYRTNSYTELETGMHYWDDGQWKESKAEINVTVSGAAATQGAHRVLFAANLNTIGAVVDLTTADGKRLRSRILGLSYFDASTGQAALIAETKDSTGLLLAPNQILYTNAFDDVDADVQYLYTKAGFAQNIVLRAQPPAPAEFGLNPATTRLQVITEFFDPPVPLKKTTIFGGTNHLTDEFLDFGKASIGPGKAFAIGESGEAGKAVRVAKQWGVLDGRTFLVEEVPFMQVDEKIRSLLNTNSGASFNPKRRGQGQTMMAALKTLLPKRMASRTGTPGTMQMARLEERSQRPGFVLDYEILGSATNFTFKGDTTYYVTNTFNLSGTTTIEGGTVVKFADSSTATISLNGPLVWQTDAYRHAVFTAAHDDSVGDGIGGSSGNPTRTSATYLNNLYVDGNGDTLWSSPIKYVRFSYAGTAMAGGDGYSFTWPVEVWHSQFVNCGSVVAFPYTCGDVRFNNVLASGCGTLLNPGDLEYGFYLSGVHVTVDACDYLGQGSSTSSSFTNTIFTGSISLSGATLDHCAQFTSSSGVYQIVGAGSYYLANGSTNRNAGTTNINADLLADLKNKTTYPPIVLTADAYWTNSLVLSPRGLCDTNALDQGYHYDVLDYALGKVALKDATITIEPGTAIGTFSPDSNFYGVGLFSGSQFLCEGTPTALNRIVHYNTVQEQANTNWSSGYSPAIYGQYVDGTPTAVAKFRFTDWSILGQGDPHFYGVEYDTLITVSDCQFHGGQIVADVPALNFTNCLFERTHVSLFNAHAAYDLCLRNNLFYGGELELIPVGGDWTLKDNLFDHTTILQYEAILIHDHNGYVTGSDRLTPTNANDVVASLIYQKGQLGTFYQPTNSTFINAGSVTNAGLAGLYHYTTTTNQMKEAGSRLDIGYHYAALDGSRNAVDTDSDGLPDYLEDANGNGVTNDNETSFTKADTDGDGLTDFDELNILIDASNPGLGHLDPLNPDTGGTGRTDDLKDSDHDGLSNLAELYWYGADPVNAHTFTVAKNDAQYFHTAEGDVPHGPRNTKASLDMALFSEPGGNLYEFTISGADSNAKYDLYFLPDLNFARWQWRRVLCDIQCNNAGEATFLLQGPDPYQGYFEILSAEDFDGDGLSDGYECWFTYDGLHTKVQDPLSDSDLMFDGWEVEYGLNPLVGTGDDGDDGNPDNDSDGMGDLTNLREYNAYNYGAPSFDPLKVFNTSANRPVVVVYNSTANSSCETASFTIERFVGEGGSNTAPLTVYYAVGGTLAYGTDYTLDPEPIEWPRIFSATIGANNDSVEVTVDAPGVSATVGNVETLVVKLTPYSVSPVSQVSSPGNWAYVVDLQQQQDRATITFDNQNLRPTANPETVQTCKNTPLEIILTGSDVCNDPLTFIKVTDPSHGSLGSITPINGTSASVTYTPNSTFCGVDSFTFKANDGVRDSDPAATITINVGNPSPVANCQDVMTGKNTPVTFTLSGSDTPCNDTLEFTVVGSGPAHGTLSAMTRIDANHVSITYTPGSNFEGTDEFHFTVNNCGFGSSSALVTLNVTPGPVLTTECRRNRIILHWTVPEFIEQQTDFISDFKIYRCETTSVSCTPSTTVFDTVTGPSARMFVDTDVDEDKTYCYRVTFRHENDCAPAAFLESPFSNIACDQVCPLPTNKTDVAFIVDNTSSMGGLPLSELKEGLAPLLDDLEAASGGDLRLALVTPNDDQVHVRLAFSDNNRTDFVDALDGVSTPGGNANQNCPESTDECLNTVVNALSASGRDNPRDCTPSSTPLQTGNFVPGFRESARKLVVMITDAAPGGFCDLAIGDDGDPTQAEIYAEAASNFPCIKINAIHVAVAPGGICPVGYDTAAGATMHMYAETTCGWYSQVPSSGEGIAEAVARMLYIAGECECEE